MRILCQHGFHKFIPRQPGDLSVFASVYGLTLVRKEDYYTFERLADLEKYSLEGLAYSNLVANSNYEGQPWEVMKENGFVYNILTGLLVLKSTIKIQIDPPVLKRYLLSETPLIQAGSKNKFSQTVLSYDGEFLFDTMQFRLNGVEYE